jgi:UDP-GlcNAc:undecaprenyl-phosphate/decaprenyl-phosphate GlcNAc-1-phosphate transferase
MTALILCLIPLAFALSFLLTFVVKRFAPRFDFVDKPGHRKIHHVPKPLGGGIAIFLAFALPLCAALLYARLARPDPSSPVARHLPGILSKTPDAVKLLAALLAIHLLGLRDDRRAMGPYSKLLIQLVITTALVLSIKDLRALTILDNLGLGIVPSVVVTVLWIAGITNAFNFLDNMDGLSAGVAAVATACFLITALLIGQWFVAAALALLLGALLGFLCFNFNPATIFMGDSGSLTIGLLLGALTIRTTYLPIDPATGKPLPLAAGWYSLLAPLIVLAVPLYDLIVVSCIRISRGKSPFVGDTNHLSHRLVARGMSRRTAVLCIYLITATTGLSAILLPLANSSLAALLIFLQTLLILALVMFLEQHPLPPPKDEG